MEYPERFSFKRNTEWSDRLDQLADMISGRLLGNTERTMLRNMAAEGQPLDLIVRGLLAYSDAIGYAQSRLDLEDSAQVLKGTELSRERKSVEFTITLLERLLTPVPEKKEPTS